MVDDSSFCFRPHHLLLLSLNRQRSLSLIPSRSLRHAQIYTLHLESFSKGRSDESRIAFLPPLGWISSASSLRPCISPRSTFKISNSKSATASKEASDRRPSRSHSRSRSVLILDRRKDQERCEIARAHLPSLSLLSFLSIDPNPLPTFEPLVEPPLKPKPSRIVH